MEKLPKPALESKVPRWLKAAYSIFMAIMVPVYWHTYGPTNFLYFCDVAAFLTLFALWLESGLIASIAAVGIVFPQMVWIIDLGVHVFGLKLTGMSDYMFDVKIPLFARVISLYHGWLPILLIYLVKRLGYDRRALLLWTAIAWALMLFCYFWMPMPGQNADDAMRPVNINYVYGFSDKAPQQWMSQWMWLIVMIAGLPLLVWWPTHFALRRWFTSSTTGSVQQRQARL